MPTLLAQTAAETFESANGFMESWYPWVHKFSLENDWVLPLVLVLVVGGSAPLLVSFLVWCERRGSALIQDRLGPNRVGPLGLFQSFADLGILIISFRLYFLNI